MPKQQSIHVYSKFFSPLMKEPKEVVAPWCGDSTTTCCFSNPGSIDRMMEY